jgi:excisionase family DNA binding protein
MRLFTLAQTAEQLGLQLSTVRFWVWTRKIAFVKLGRAVRVSEDTIRELVERGSVPARRS